MEATASERTSGRYCRCGNVSILGDVGIASEVRLVSIASASQGTNKADSVVQQHPVLTQLRHSDGVFVRCLSCNTDVARVEGIHALADLDKVTAVTMLETIDLTELEAQPGYSKVFRLVLPAVNVQDDASSSTLPPQVQHTLESAVQKQKAITQTQISAFTSEKNKEFKQWREQARKQARIIAKLAERVSSSASWSSPSRESTAPLAIPTSPTSQSKQGSELFPKSPVIPYAHPGASPLAAASLTRSQSARASTPSPPPAKITPPPGPLSSSLKSPSSGNYSKPVKRVMFQDPPDIEVHSDAEEDGGVTVFGPEIPASVDTEPVISVDDVLFDFDETIPGISLESDTTTSSQGSSPAPPVHSPLFAPPLSPFRRRSVEKYDLPEEDDDDEDPFDNIPTKHSNGVRFKEPEDLFPSSYSKPIAITPPSRSFLSERMHIEEDEDEGGMQGHIQRMSLKNTRSASQGNFEDPRMLWDIPGDYYRDVPS